MLPRRFLIHTAGVVAFGYTLYWHYYFFQIPPHPSYNTGFVAILFKSPGPWKYLTAWNMVIQFIHHAFSLASLVMESSQLIPPKRLKMVRLYWDAVFVSVVFPLGVFVFITFWVIYGVDRELISPKILDDFYPAWMNHAVHTTPAIFLFIELYFIPKVFPKRSEAIVGNISFSLAYIGWACFLAHFKGVWVYPVLSILESKYRAIFFASNASVVLGIYFAGEKFQKWRLGGSFADPEEEPAVVVKNGKKKIN